MPHATLKLVPGTDTQETPALNENSGVSQTNLIRFFQDRNGLGLVQKLGGWTRYFGSAMPAIVRALHAWEDLNDNSHLAVGTQTTSSGSAQLSVITNGTQQVITPTYIEDDVSPAVATTAGSTIATVTDNTTTGITNYDSVYITTQISVGGIVLFGLYACDPDGFQSTNAYTVDSVDILGNPNPATASSTTGFSGQGTLVLNSAVLAITTATSGLLVKGMSVSDAFSDIPADTLIEQQLTGTPGGVGTYQMTAVATATVSSPETITGAALGPVLPVFTTVSGSTTVTVTLPNYTYAVGITVPILVATTVGGITLYGNYIVQTIIDVNHFTILSATAATSSASETLNGGNAQYIYSLGSGTIPGGTGYGAGAYGSGGYGTGSSVNPPVGTAIDALDWTLDNWGEVLISCPDRLLTPGTTPFQPLYQWDPNQGSAAATIITNAPPVNDGVFVAMPQRQIVVWGTTVTGIQDPLLIAWCDVNNYNVWYDLPTNQAGTYRIPKGSRIVGMVQGPQQALAWTDVGVWSMQYIGPPNIYSFNQIGDKCGLIARKAAAFVNGIGYWMGPKQFYILDAAAVQTLPCSVWDVVYQNLNAGIVSGIPNTYKIRCAVNSNFNEITWYYPSANGTGEIDSYVKYNLVVGQWDYGTLGRTAWIDQSVLGPPIGADPNTLLIYQHETSNDADGQAMASFFQTGYYTLNEGDFQTFMDLIWPDMKWALYNQVGSTSASVQISFYVLDYPGDTPVVFGPYTVTQATKFFNTRLRGRLVAVRISSDDLGSFWRLGALRYRFASDGKF
jgi:hypothetical protein